jgi:hypothetical protein
MQGILLGSEDTSDGQPFHKITTDLLSQACCLLVLMSVSQANFTKGEQCILQE